MDTYKYKIKCTFNYYGWPQAERKYEVKADYVTILLHFYGNQGYDIPKVKEQKENNGYFWQLNTFMETFYKTGLRYEFSKLREGEELTLIIDISDKEHYKIEKN